MLKIVLKNIRTNKGLVKSVFVVGLVVYCSLLFISVVCCKLASSFLVGSLYNNGTELYRSTVIMISIDGFKMDYLSNQRTPFMYQLSKQSLLADSLIPSFPTITFPNHYTLVTGLYPDYHGIIGNNFLEPETHIEFKHIDPIAKEEKWWSGEPIWETVQKHSLLSAVHMWPGSDVDHQTEPQKSPTYYQRYVKNFSLNKKVEEITNYLDMPYDKRPSMLNVYVNDIDSVGHKTGTNSAETNIGLKKVDNMIKEVFNKLQERNLDNIVNVVVVSDHGMADVDPSKIIFLDDYIDLDLVYGPYVFPFAGLVPKNKEDTEKIYAKLKAVSSRPQSNWKVYKRSEIPKRYFYGSNKRGYGFSTRKEFKLKGYQLGLHGYDNMHPDMQALFLAHGPAFPPKRIPSFANVNVYNLLCYVLGINASPNNGTMDWSKIL